MKKLLSLLLIAVFYMSVVSCAGSKSEKEKTQPNTLPEQSSATETEPEIKSPAEPKNMYTIEEIGGFDIIADDIKHPTTTRVYPYNIIRCGEKYGLMIMTVFFRSM